MLLFNLTRWPSVLVFLLAGTATVVFAFVTANLFTHAMANVSFVQEFGLIAIKNGAWLQALELFAWGALALSCWLIFKICEHILEDRYLDWAARRRSE